MAKNFFITIPHSGEKIPQEAFWLEGLIETDLMCDVDRYVDQIYSHVISKNNIDHITAQWHRYAADLNRLPGDVDETSVESSSNPKGSFPIGLHWTRTTKGFQLMKEPISLKLHKTLLEKCYYPFHTEVKQKFETLFNQGFKKVYQLDAHSMPSRGTEVHRDPGEDRAEIVISDYHGKSCDVAYKDLVVKAFESAGFQVAYNHPYIGGRLTQTYGQPSRGQNTIQVEINRKIYMNEETKKLNQTFFKNTQSKIEKAIDMIYKNVEVLK